ncbi:DUF4163 domain-containing protein [Novosphingobium sp. FGD1]|uniref:DUF4163 domain-containing protein n=1 Tax=Novosphingobium silvae TaxID=2692619 RepID=A0A7X4K5M9_9SPHN|nr:DUF4163 domain-containing protein [Novosphingobium silvae]MYL96310.1 DUF4163 domain-containing protein [Novosphingobium silvae]
MRYRGLVAIMALTGAAACGTSPQPAPSASATLEADGSPATPAPATEAPPPKGRAEKVSNEFYSFAYAYPAQAAAIPALNQMLEGRLEAARSDVDSSARAGKAEMDKDGYPFHAYERQVDWRVVTDLPGWLSLSATLFEYSGGAHGMTNYDTLLWDRAAGTPRKPAELFTNAESLRQSIQAPFCDALDQQRAKKRGEPVQRGGQMFTECIDPTAQTLILGSSNNRTFDRIGVLVAPYEAGPYAEGSYEITLPVTGKVMAALKPQYRSAFSARN